MSKKYIVDSNDFISWKVEQIAASCTAKRLKVIVRPYSNDLSYEVVDRTTDEMKTYHFECFHTALDFYNQLDNSRHIAAGYGRQE